MKSLRNFPLALSFCAFLLSNAQAGMAPDFGSPVDSEVDEAMRSVITPKARSQSAPSFPVSLTGPNRIAIEGKKIVNAIYDNTQLELQSDTVTGQVFVFPKTENPAALFLTTEDRQTHALTLVPQSTSSQEIVIQSQAPVSKTVSPYAQKTFSQTVLSAPDIESQITRLIRAMARGEVPDGFHFTNRCGKDCVRSLSSETLEGVVSVHRNTSASPVMLEEKLFYRKGVLAVAITQPHLNPGESTSVFIVSQKTGNVY